jgi:FkbM family methyltransferase
MTLAFIRSLFRRQRPAEEVEPEAEGPVSTSAEDDLRQQYTRRERFIITDLVSEYLPPDERFFILDGGAREALDDPRWRVFDHKRVTLHGFEVDPVECEKLNHIVKEMGLDYHYHPVGLWSREAKLPFYENKAPGGGSFYPQNVALTNRWKFQNKETLFYARDMFYPTNTVEAKLTSIDHWAEEAGITKIDFMKLNVQGAELEILEGSESIIDGVIGIQVEVSLVESYHERPMFADIDRFLRQQGFTFFDFIGHHCIGRASSPITAQHCPGLYPLWGQLIEGHGVYFRDPIDLEAKGRDIRHLTAQKILKLACFAEIYGQAEFAFELLRWLSERLSRLGKELRATEVEHLLDQATNRYRSILGG